MQLPGDTEATPGKSRVFMEFFADDSYALKRTRNLHLQTQTYTRWKINSLHIYIHAQRQADIDIKTSYPGHWGDPVKMSAPANALPLRKRIGGFTYANGREMRTGMSTSAASILCCLDHSSQTSLTMFSFVENDGWPSLWDLDRGRIENRESQAGNGI